MPTSAEFNAKEKSCALVIGFLECLLFGGVIYGWADLVYVMKQEGIFHDKCTNASLTDSLNIRNETWVPSCETQDDMFDLAFTVASFGRGLGALLVSLLLDFTGLRITRLVAIISVIIGGFFIGFTSQVHPNYLFPGSLLIALGGAELRLADFQIANMFPKYKATVMSVYNGAFCGSGAVFLFLKYAAINSKDRSTFMYVWTGISALMLFPTFLLLPKSNIIAIDEAEMLYVPNSLEVESSGFGDEQLLSNDESVNVRREQISKDSFVHSLKTVSFWFHIYAAGNVAVGITLYIATFNLWVNSITSDREEISYLSEVYGFCQFPMIVVAPMVGIIMDTAVKRALNEQDPVIKRNKLQRAGFISLMWMSITTTSLIVCKIFPTVLSVKSSLAIYTIASPTMNAVAPGYLRIRFPQGHFNKLMGILGTIAAVYSFVQFPLFNWIMKDPHLSNIVIAVLMATTAINALHLLCLKSKSN